MNARLFAPLAVSALALAAGGCGASASPSTGAPNPSQKQEFTRLCLVDEGFDAKSVGEVIQIDGPAGPRVEFNISGGESETRAFKGEAQGAEQIGSTLLFVESADDAALEKIETCVVG